MSVSCECCVLSDRGSCVGLITHRDESHRVGCVWVWSWNLNNEEALAHWGLLCHGEKSNVDTQLLIPWFFRSLFMTRFLVTGKVFSHIFVILLATNQFIVFFTSTSSSRVPLSHITQHNIIVQHGFAKVAGLEEIILQVGRGFSVMLFGLHTVKISRKQQTYCSWRVITLFLLLIFYTAWWWVN